MVNPALGVAEEDNREGICECKSGGQGQEENLF